MKIKTKSGKSLSKDKAVLVKGNWYSKVQGKNPEVMKIGEGEFVISDFDKYTKPEDYKYYYPKHATRAHASKVDGELVFRYYTDVHNMEQNEGKHFTGNIESTHYYIKDGPLMSRAKTVVYTKDLELLKEMGYSYCMAHARYVTNPIKTKEFCTPNKNKGRVVLKRGDYSTSDLIKLGFKTPSYRISEGAKYSFGVELETSSGNIPTADYHNKKLNLQCVHDGSVDGGEYVTGILRGDAGFKQLHKVCKELSAGHQVNSKCGIHVHIGGVVFNKQFNVLAYILGRKIEKSLFSILPKSRRNNKFCGYLPNLSLNSIMQEFGTECGFDVAYESLFNALSNDKKLGREFNKSTNHPYGRYCGQYQDHIANESILRYKWLNLVPCNFNIRKYHPSKKMKSKANLDTPYTIEFRNHSATLNYTKIRNWVLVCMAFVNYVENNMLDILNKDVITLEDILESAYPKNAKNLLTYVQERRELFSTSAEASEYKVDAVKPITNIKEFVCV